MIQPQAAFPVYVVKNPTAAVGFYTQLGFSEVFNSGWYVHLVTESGVQIGFLEPNHATQPEILHAPFSGAGSLFSLEVADAETAYQEAQALKLEITQPLKSEDWGQRHFMLRDPHGVIIDIVQTTEPTEEFAKQYTSDE